MSDSIHHQSEDNACVVETAIVRRRSVRHFSSRPIATYDLDRLIAAGVAAPSGSNWQNQRFLVITDPAEIMRLGSQRFVWPYKAANIPKVKESHPSGIIGHGAALIIVFSDSKENDRRGNGEYHLWQSLEIQNCAASIENILLMATALGIGSCWVSASDKMNYTRMLSGGSWRKMLINYKIPPQYSMQGIIILGYPKTKDELGYPKGESKHGATVWQTTERKPIEHYLIQERTGDEGPERDLSSTDKLTLRLLSKGIRKCQRATAILDGWVHRIEFGKYLKKD